MEKKMKTQKTERKRYEYLEVLRGITLISMMGYHAMWDLVYIVGLEIDWYRSAGAYLWQQSICWTFILLSGFCWSFGRQKWKRGGIVFAAGLVITGVTCLVMPQQRVVFGVLTLLGSCMLLMIPLEKILRGGHSVAGLIVSFCAFLLTKNLNQGALGIGNWRLLELPDSWYDSGYLMTYLGFTDRHFYSTDYFSLFPWMFLFMTGYFLYRLASEKRWLEWPTLNGIKSRPLAFIGRHSLLLYMLHQPVIYLVIRCCF